MLLVNYHAARMHVRSAPGAPPPLPAAALAAAARGRCRVRVAAAVRQADAAVTDDGNVASSQSGRASPAATAPIGSEVSPPVAQTHGPLQQWHTCTRQLMRLAALATAADAAASLASQAASGPALASSDGWVALASHFTSFLILTSVFIADREAEAAVCYAAGLVGSLALLLQAWLLGGAPTAVLLAALLLAGGAAAVNAALLRSSSHAAAAWRLWRGVLGAAGFAMLPQVFYLSAVLPASGAPGWAAASASWAPAAVGLALFAGLALALRAGLLPRSCWDAWDVPAWAATLLFMLEPLAALASAARDPGALASASLPALLLPAVVTGLQVPRALLVREHMWATGTSWSTLFACLQAALVANATGRPSLAAALVLVPWLGAAWLLHRNAVAEGHGSMLQSVQPIAATYRRQLRPWRQLAARLRNSLRRHRVAA